MHKKILGKRHKDDTLLFERGSHYKQEGVAHQCMGVHGLIPSKLCCLAIRSL